MANDSMLEIVAYGAWNGGTVVDNSIYEPMQLQFKGGIPVNNKTIEELNDIDLLFEHQANFAMIPLTLAQLSDLDAQQTKKMVADQIANKMVTNVHERGNCSIVCMQRLPYDLQRGALQPDSIQGFAINRNLETLKRANLRLNDSVGAGMTRSSFVHKKR